MNAEDWDQRKAEIDGMLDALKGLTMPIGQTISELDRIERFLRVRGWKRDVNPLREIEYTPLDGEWRVQVIASGYWWLSHFTDADRPVFGHDGAELLMAVGRYESVEEGDTVESLEKAMVGAGAMPWECPYCGESGGEPRTAYSRELYGSDADGNRGEWREYAEECCSKCIKS
jgi:hypothetical protein